MPPSLDTLAAALGDSVRRVRQRWPQGNPFTLDVSFVGRLRQHAGRWQFDVVPTGRRLRGPTLHVRIACDATGTHVRIDAPAEASRAAR